MSRPPIRLLLVEDTPVVREFMQGVFEADPAFLVVGTACDGIEAIDMMQRLQPDVVLMDVHMPNMDGIEATRRIMHDQPVPIVIVSATVEDEVAATFSALEAGALAFLRRPAGLGHPLHRREVAELTRTVRLMSEVKVVRRSRRDGQAQPSHQLLARPQLVAVGASTGGPLAIQALLQGLPADFRVPILVVQHIAEGFLEGFVDWLDSTSPLRVHLATDGEQPLPGHAYVGPDRLHLGVDRKGRIRLSDDPPLNGLRPAVDFLFRSVRTAYGASAAGVLLSGMGRDGAAELLALRRCGAQTFVQNKESAVVYGMPGAALALDAALHVMAPEEIGRELTILAGTSDGGGGPSEARP